jgi:hypothetical protein
LRHAWRRCVNSSTRSASMRARQLRSAGPPLSPTLSRYSIPRPRVRQDRRTALHRTLTKAPRRWLRRLTRRTPVARRSSTFGTRHAPMEHRRPTALSGAARCCSCRQDSSATSSGGATRLAPPRTYTSLPNIARSCCTTATGAACPIATARTLPSRTICKTSRRWRTPSAVS